METLLISGELDFTPPPQVATKELLPHLPNGHQVVVPSFGCSTSFWAEQPEAGTRLINTFFGTGRVDDSLYRPATVDFTPAVTQTALAKGLAGDWSATIKATGFATAAGGALIGAWLGFNAGTDMLALMTTIVGASSVRT